MDKAQEILDRPSGGRYWRVDLHVHTPGSRDTHPSNREMGPEEVVAAALASHVDVIAVTDHNSVEWCEQVMGAAEGTGLVALPGVEISTREGHLIAVFDRDKPMNELREFLVTQGIREADFGNLEAIARGGIDEVARDVVAEGGVAIAAHVSAPKGFLAMVLAGARRTEIHECDALTAFETHDPELARELLDGGRYPRSVACVQGSDSWTEEGEGHRVAGIGTRYCYIKMDGVSMRGLSQAFIDPDVRVRPQTEPPKDPTPIIEGLLVSDGFLQNQPLRFNPNITCLIGGTGAGKSASVEMIRFALDQQADSGVLPAVRREVEGLLSFALLESTTVSVLLRKGDDLYLVERVWLRDASTKPTVHRVASDGTIGDAVDGVHVPTFFPIKAFSQGEIIEYAREPLARLTLLDDLLSLDSYLEAATSAKGRLNENATQLMEAERKLAAARQRLRELPTVQEQIRGLDRFFADDRVRDHPVWYQERGILDAAAESILELREASETEFPTLGSSLVSQVPPSPKNADTLDALRALDEAIRGDVATKRDEFSDAIAGFVERLNEIRTAWDARFQEADREYRQLLVELDKDGLGRAALASKLEELRTREQRLLQLNDALERQHMPRLEALHQERDALLDQLQSARRSITLARQDKARELTKRLEDRVRIQVKRDEDGRRFLETLKVIRVGSRVRDEDLETMARELHPVPFVKSLLARDFSALASKSNLDERLFERLADNVAEKHLEKELYELQLADLNDVVRVQFAVEASQYKELEALAHGQKCTVVLMISLAEGDAPFLVDQPEDALHAPWIEEYIVSRLRGDRGMRQCLFATRSANVLVSADAEQILAMESNAGRGWLRQSGSIDRFDTRDLVVYHVEGGEKPFSRRRLKYGL